MNTNTDHNSTENNNLKDKTILITGAAHGIGKALALHFAEQQAEVLLLDKDQAGLDQVYDEIIEKTATTPIQLHCDLSELTEENCKEIHDNILTHCKKLDALIHNAALLGKLTLLEQYPLDTWQTVFQTNLTSAFMLTKALLPCLRLSNNARVIFSSDSAGQQHKAHWGAYAISKAATDAMMKQWSEELAHLKNLRFYSVDPGPVRTAMRAEAFPAEDPNKVVAPETIIGSFRALLSEDYEAPSGSIVELTQKPN